MNNTKVKILSDILFELKTLPRENPKELMKKYDIIFFGEKFNKITSIELTHYIKNNIDNSITHEDVLNLLPSLNGLLGIQIEGLISLENIGKSQKPDAFFITLF